MKPTIWCLAHRVGVKRISNLIYKETYGVLKIFTENVICDAMTYTGQAQRRKMTPLSHHFLEK
ncbi:Histone H [Trema orientale]|uniref:Histone H4 n=1 Tax=Trema orientale TaxID=63057 RepID=A0A2P5AN32_TREOI|nr:Histone H [Trema orientale]